MNKWLLMSVLVTLNYHVYALTHTNYDQNNDDKIYLCMDRKDIPCNKNNIDKIDKNNINVAKITSRDGNLLRINKKNGSLNSHKEKSLTIVEETKIMEDQDLTNITPLPELSLQDTENQILKNAEMETNAETELDSNVYPKNQKENALVEHDVKQKGIVIKNKVLGSYTPIQFSYKEPENKNKIYIHNTYKR